MVGNTALMDEVNISDSGIRESLIGDGLNDLGKVHCNLDVDTLIERAVSEGEVTETSTGAILAYTGKHTGRSPQDRFIVRDALTEDTVDWGIINQPFDQAAYEQLRRDQQQHLVGKEVYVGDSFVGADPKYRVAVRAVNEQAWANLFCRQLFIRPNKQELERFTPEYRIIHTPSFKADPARHGTKSETFVVVNFTDKLVLIGGTLYAGEMKKSMFSILNYLNPRRGVMSMHCSANVEMNGKGNSALFFGLSGTGKTTLSADPKRRLIGDDEHGWTEDGIFNYEGGCYAKCIKLSKENEPQIWSAIRKGAILENVVVDDAGVPDYDDGSITENTRVAYPVDFIEGAVLEGTGPHPSDVVFLTCDAFGVMPPISRLSKEQAMYHFLSGYTAKVAGTEKGLGNEPQPSFSTCFGAPFLPLKPTKYAELLGEKLDQHKTRCWLINTGWSGGGVDVGARIKLPYTRRMVEAALSGELDNVEFIQEPVFGLSVPTEIEGVPSEILQPKTQWSDKSAYDKTANDLAKRFRDNFARFETFAPELVKAGPA